MQRQILRELSFNRSCDSPHIVKYYTSFLTPDSSSIAICMEYCAGRSLDNVYKQVKKRGGRTGERVLGKIACGVLGGLSYLHERKIIHRGMRNLFKPCMTVDIKPSNILITQEGNVKLCDFGVSGELVDSLAGTFTGTSYYMAVSRPFLWCITDSPARTNTGWKLYGCVRCVVSSALFNGSCTKPISIPARRRSTLASDRITTIYRE